MTTTATTGKTASNGKASPAPAERKDGLLYVSESVCYHMASIAHDAAFEAERLCNDVYRAVSGAYLRDGSRASSEAAELAHDPWVTARASEAVRCMQIAEQYLRQLTATDPPY